MKKYLLAVILMAQSIVAFASVEIVNLRCEYSQRPLGLDIAAPRFTWEYSGDGMVSGMPVVEVSMDSIFRKPLKIKADSKFKAIGAKLGLKPQTRYFWRVKASDDGRTVVSPIAVFETGKSRSEPWKATWISDGLTKDEPVTPVFRKQFDVDAGALNNGRVYVSAVGYYDMRINGKRVGDHHMDPGFTDYNKRSLYAVHDVTPLLRQGENEVTVILGNGFANNQNHDVWNQENAPWRDRPQFICEIYAGGKLVAATDTTWQTALSDVVYNNIYSGDHIDGLVGEPCAWKNAVVVSPKSNLLVAQAQPAIRPVEEIEADLLRSFGDTLFIFDMGKNIAGVCDIWLKGARGTKVKVRHGELLKSNGLLERGNIDIYYHPARDDEEFQTDNYVLSGNPEGDRFHPRFSYHGFRYVEVASDSPVKVENLTGRFMRTDLARTGYFRCSDSLLNRIYDATMLSYECNLHSIPTDCPQREKNGWTADAHVAARLGMLNYDGITFYEKWMRDFIDSQKESGNIPGIVPSAGWGYGEWPGPVWDAALFIVPSAIYDYYGDATILHELYPTMVRYFDWVRSLKKSDGTLVNGIGDWLSARTQTPTDFSSTLYYYVDNKLMARICGIIGKDPAPYIKEMEATAQVINNKFLDTDSAAYAGGTQAAQAIALYWDVVPDSLRQRVADKLNQMIADNGYALDFGLLGSKSVLRMLTRYGHTDTAMKMALRTDAPSWGYWLEKCGQTTLGETWVMDPHFRDASLNHVFMGDIAAWMTNDLAGLDYDPSHPGFENVIVNPHFVEALDWAEASYHSVKGVITVSWKRRDDNKIELAVELPIGVTATLFPAAKSEHKLSSGHHILLIDSHM